MKIFKFMAQCQDTDIVAQYEKYGVRCFDLRLRFKEGTSGIPQVNHNLIVYDISVAMILQHLGWLDDRQDVAVRVLLDVRSKKRYTEFQRDCFSRWCKTLSEQYINIKFWCGRNLYNWKEEYHFEYNPSCDEKYSSVCSPKLIDDWYPRWFAKKNTKKIYEAGSKCNYLMLDFINYIE